MTKTVQFCSWAVLNDTGKDLAIKSKCETAKFQYEDFQPGDNMKLLLSVCDSLNKLNEKLGKLDFLLKRRLIEQSIYCKGKGE